MREFDFSLQTNMFGKTDAKAKLSKLSTRQLRAIKHFCELNGCTVQMSTRPIIRFRDKITGESIEAHIDEVVAIYTEDQKEAARVKRYAKQQVRSVI